MEPTHGTGGPTCRLEGSVRYLRHNYVQHASQVSWKICQIWKSVCCSGGTTTCSSVAQCINLLAHHANVFFVSLYVLQEAKRKEHWNKMQAFMDRMPSPPVAVARWRTCGGANKSVDDAGRRKQDLHMEVEDKKSRENRQRETNAHQRKAEVEQLKLSKWMTKACEKTFTPTPSCLKTTFCGK